MWFSQFVRLSNIFTYMLQGFVTVSFLLPINIKKDTLNLGQLRCSFQSVYFHHLVHSDCVDFSDSLNEKLKTKVTLCSFPALIKAFYIGRESTFVKYKTHKPDSYTILIQTIHMNRLVK